MSMFGDFPIYPEWVGGASKNAGYAPPDIGSQQSQLNFTQDLMGMNPQMLAMMQWLAGQMDGGMLASTYEPAAGGRLDGTDEIIREANTAGRDALMAAAFPNGPDGPPGTSVEALIAEHILSGGSPIEAVQLAKQKGLIPQAMKDVYKDGVNVGKEPDNSIAEYYTKWATDAYGKMLQDTSEQRQPAKEVLHPFVQSMIDAGFSDPRQQYTADGAGGNFAIDPDLQRIDAKVAAQQPGVDEALRQRDLMSKFVAQSRTPQRGTKPMGIEEERHNAQPAWMGTSVGDPEWQKLALTPQPATMPHPDMGGVRFNAIPQNFDPMQAARERGPAPFGSAVDAANLFERRMAGGYNRTPDRAAIAKRSSDVSRKAGQLNMKHARDKNTASLARIKATAVENHLRSQGRSPARDQYQAAMAALLSRFG